MRCPIATYIPGGRAGIDRGNAQGKGTGEIDAVEPAKLTLPPFTVRSRLKYHCMWQCHSVNVSVPTPLIAPTEIVAEEPVSRVRSYVAPVTAPVVMVAAARWHGYRAKYRQERNRGIAVTDDHGSIAGSDVPAILIAEGAVAVTPPVKVNTSAVSSPRVSVPVLLKVTAVGDGGGTIEHDVVSAGVRS